MGSPTVEFVVDVIFYTTNALRVFWKVLPRAIGQTLHYKVGAQHLLSLLCGKVRVSPPPPEKTVMSTKKTFGRGPEYLQIVQERSEVAHSCLYTPASAHEPPKYGRPLIRHSTVRKWARALLHEVSLSTVFYTADWN